MNDSLLIPPLIQTICCLCLAFVVLYKHFKSATHILFSLFLVCLAVWGLIIFGMRASIDTQHAYQWDRLLVMLTPFAIVTFYHFTILYTGRKINRFVLPSFYVLCVIFIPLAFTDLVFSGIQQAAVSYAPIFGLLFIVWLIPVIACLILSLFNIFRTRLTSTDLEQRNRLNYIVAGIIICASGNLYDVLISLGLPSYPIGTIGIIVFCAVTTVAILKYNLLDIRIVLRKGTVYILTSILIALPVVVLSIILTSLFYNSHLAIWIYVPLVVIIAFIFPPLWTFINNDVNRWFFRDRYAHINALKNFNWQTQSLVDYEIFNITALQLIKGSLQASDIYLLQPSTNNNEYHIVSSTSAKVTSDFVIEADSELIKWLNRYNKTIHLSDLYVISQLQDHVRDERLYLEKLGIEIIVPLNTPSGYLSGILLISKKVTDESYNSEDLQIISATANQIVISLENVRLYHDLSESRNIFLAWLHSMSDCVIIVDSMYKIQFMNDAAVKTFGNNIDSKCWEMLGQQNECLECPLKYNLELSNRQPAALRRMMINDKKYGVATAPTLNPDGSMSLIEVFRDVTERERLIEEIIKAQVQIESLHQSEKMKTELISMVSHDLRTPLSIIKGYTETILRRYKDLPEQELIDFLTEIDAETKYLNRLVGKLLGMARIESGTLQLNRDWYQISEILEGVDSSINALTKEHKLVRIIPSPLPPVFVDRVYIGEVLINLCENAVKYTAKGKQITINAKLDNDSIVVSVIDEGPGIAAEDRVKIFKRFYRVNHYDSAQTGIGLGLPICVGIIEEHGGKIWVESEPGAGSKFSFSIPL